MWRADCIINFVFIFIYINLKIKKNKNRKKLKLFFSKLKKSEEKKIRFFF